MLDRDFFILELFHKGFIMGSFSTQCFASHQTIARGDACLIFPVIQQSTFEKFFVRYRGSVREAKGAFSFNCYPESFWSPFSGAIEAVYADYGAFKLVDSPTNRLRLLNFFSRLHETVVSIEAELQDEQGTIHYNIGVRFVLSDLLSETPQLKALLENSIWHILKESDSPGLFDEMERLWSRLRPFFQDSQVTCQTMAGHLSPVQFAVLHQKAIAPLIDLARSQLKSSDINELLLNAYGTMRQSVLTDNPIVVADRFINQLRADVYQARQLPEGYYHEIVFWLDSHLDNTISKEALLRELNDILHSLLVHQGLKELDATFLPMRTILEDYTNEKGNAYRLFVQEVSLDVTQSRNAWLDD